MDDRGEVRVVHTHRLTLHLWIMTLVFTAMRREANTSVSATLILFSKFGVSFGLQHHE